jgi:hypothetical protein
MNVDPKTETSRTLFALVYMHGGEADLGGWGWGGVI